MHEPVLGIDLGTTNSVGALFENGRVRVVPNQEGERITPSVVAFSGRDILVGSVARRQAASNPRFTFHSVKRIIGQGYDAIRGEVSHWGYTVVEGPRKLPRLQTPSGTASAEEVQAHVLRKLKAAADASAGKPVRQAVITVPANFNDRQRQATRDAGRLAGLDVRRIISEPTAAVLAYGLDAQDDAVLLAYDFGGGTFDVSVLRIRGGIVQVLATAGDAHLGGNEIDLRVAEWLLHAFEKQAGCLPVDDPATRVRFLEAAEQAKIALSSALETDVRIPFLATAAGAVHHLEVRLTRARLEAMISELVEATVQACRRALGDAKIRPHDVSDVLLVGGSSRIPAVRRAIEGFIGREPRDAIAPDEIVAMGAAVQGGILVGAIRNLDFQDVLPLSLGIQTAHGSFTRVIPRNTPIPASVTRTFSTARDHQASVGLHVLQGERAEAAGNASLGQFTLKDLPPMPRGTPRVEVTFDVDADGILHVSAREGITGKGKRVVVKSRTGLSEEELTKLLAEADRHRQQDEQAEKLAEQRNLLDGLIVEIERALKATGLSPERAATLKALLDLGQEAMDSGDGPTLEAASEEILQAFRMRREE